ncbi:Reverse transcriptase zinc-binding domain [Sesbania bispinosa]|nr:Reverse transcriptase zinc-binding domain [Sesbania bispinosa]
MWYDEWLPIGKSCDHVTFVDIQTRVQDVCRDGVWDLHTFYTSFPAVVQDSLTSISPFLCEGVNDLIVWGTSLSGKYTVRDAYSWLLHQDQTIAPVKTWAWIWKLQAPESIRFMLWQAASDLLPTKVLLRNRHLCIVATCYLCHQEDEDVLHCLRDCIDAGRVWNALECDSIPFFLQLDNAFDWIHWSVCTFGSLFLAGVWLIW